MSKPLDIPQSLLEAAALADADPTRENVRALLDAMAKLIVREIVGKAVGELVEKMIDEGYQSGGFVPLDLGPIEPRPISTRIPRRRIVDLEEGSE